jgi:hypothetical protein
MDLLTISDIKTIDDLEKFVINTENLLLPKFNKYIIYKYPAPLITELLKYTDQSKVKKSKGKSNEEYIPPTDQPKLDYTKLEVIKDDKIPTQEELEKFPMATINKFKYYIISKTRLVGDDALFSNVLDMQKKILKPHEFKLPDSPYITDEIRADVATAQAELNEKHIPVMVQGLDDLKIHVMNIIENNFNFNSVV